MRVDHELGDPHLLVDAPGHDRLVHALVRAADEVAVEVAVHIVHGLDVGQGLVDEQVVHIEGVPRQHQPALPQKPRAVEHGVHQQILGRAEVADVVPGEDLLRGEHVPVAHDLARVVRRVLVDVVGDHHVHRRGHTGELPQLLHHRGERRLVQPVVGVHDLVVQPLRVPQPLIDARPVPAVFLVDGPDEVRVAGRPRVALGGGVVLGGAVVDEQDLRLRPGGQQRLDAVVHIVRRVVAGHGEGDEFFHSALNLVSGANRPGRAPGRRWRPCCSSGTPPVGPAGGGSGSGRRGRRTGRSGRCSPR